nr:unnamed protein product [Callosobruchus analis]
MGQEFLEDDERPGRPVEVITEDKVALVEELVLCDRRLKVKEIAEMTKLSEVTGDAIGYYLSKSKMAY